jgi:hypothetical protein
MDVPENLRNLDAGLIVTSERSQKTPHSGIPRVFDRLVAL